MPHRFRPLSSAFSTSASPRVATSPQHWRSVVRHIISKFRRATPSSSRGVSNSSSSQHIGEPRRRVRLGDIKSAGIARLDNDIDIVLEASVMKEHSRGEAVVSSRQNHDIEEQETGVELVSKLPQIVSIANYAQGRPAPRESFILRL